jgi:hypothetical protein
MYWLGDNDPIKINAINNGPIVDFFILLDERVRQAKQQLKGIDRRLQKSKK